MSMPLLHAGITSPLIHRDFLPAVRARPLGITWISLLHMQGRSDGGVPLLTLHLVIG